MQLEISAKSSPENSNYSVDVDDFVRDKFSPTNTNANINMNEIKPIQVWDEFCRKMDDERPEINPPQTILLNKMKLAVTDVEVNIVKIKVDDGRIVKSGVKFDNSDDASKSDGDDFDHVNINSDSDGQQRHGCGGSGDARGRHEGGVAARPRGTRCPNGRACHCH